MFFSCVRIHYHDLNTNYIKIMSNIILHMRCCTDGNFWTHFVSIWATELVWCKISSLMQNDAIIISKILTSWFLELLTSGIDFSLFLQPRTVFSVVFYLHLVLKKENQIKCKKVKSYVLIPETLPTETLVIYFKIIYLHIIFCCEWPMTKKKFFHSLRSQSLTKWLAG